MSVVSIVVSIGFFAAWALLYDYFVGQYPSEDRTPGSSFGLGISMIAVYLAAVVPVGVLLAGMLLLGRRRPRSRPARIVSRTALVLAAPAFFSFVWLF